LIYLDLMVVISYGTLREFMEEYPDSEDALNNWYRATLAADWSNFHEMKTIFNSVDAVGNDRFVFNIRGNNYRLVAMIFFDIRTVFIRFIGLHKEYDKIDCTTI
jgi:mRNA interferase HigB